MPQRGGFSSTSKQFAGDRVRSAPRQPGQFEPRAPAARLLIAMGAVAALCATAGVAMALGTASAPMLASAFGGDIEDLPDEDATEIDEPVLPGTVLCDRYIVGKVFAEGGMGVVCIGRHRDLGHLVAIKFLRRDICDRPSIVHRFLNEGKAAASLR